MGGRGGNANREPIGRGFGHRIRANVATRTRAVFHDHGTQAVFDPLGQKPRGHIDGATGGIGHDQPDRLATRCGLCSGQTPGQHHRGDQHGPSQSNEARRICDGHGGAPVVCCQLLALSASVMKESAKNESLGKPAWAQKSSRAESTTMGAPQA